MIGARLPRAALEARRRRRELAWTSDRRTIALGTLAALAGSAAVAVEYGRIWRRGSAPLPRETDNLLGAAEEAAIETVEVARLGYQEVSSRETAMFNLLASFATSLAAARSVSTLLRRRGTVGPFRNLVVGRRHIHHFVPGIVLAFISGAAAIVTRDEELESKLALVFGTGMGLTMDESALLLELEDVYWKPEGIVSVQIGLAATALLAAVALGLRFLRRGEEIAFESETPPPPRVAVEPVTPPRPWVGEGG